MNRKLKILGLTCLIILSYLLIFKNYPSYSLAKELFNLPTPFTGLTRSVKALVNGNIISSLSYNYLAIPICCIIIYFTYYLVIDILKDSHLLETKFNKFSKYYPLIIIILIINTIIIYLK